MRRRVDDKNIESLKDGALVYDIVYNPYKTALISKALKYASVNAASVVENFGAQKGFLSFDEIEKRLKSHPEFIVKVI